MTITVTLPFQLQNGTTADATQAMANYNALVAGFLSAASAGANSDITALTGLTTPLVYTAGGASAYIGTTSTGTANAQVVATTVPTGFSLVNGKRVTFIASATNTGATTLNVNAQGATAVLKRTPAGPVALTGGEIIIGNLVEAIYDGTQFQLLTTDATLGGPLTSLASATPDLGTIASHNVNITGVTTITSFGSSASTTFPIYQLTFAGALLLTYDATSLILPGLNNITTVAGDSAVAMYLGSGNWRVLSYTRSTSLPGSQVISGTYRALVVTGTSDTQWTCTADALTAENSAGAAKRLTAVSVTCAITSSGANGLDTGAEASNTWYYAFVIYNPTTNTTASLMSLSATAPTLPSGYTFFVRVGAVRNDGSSNLYRTLQAGAFVTYIVGTNPVATPLAANGTAGTMSDASPTLASVSLASWVPPTARAAYMTAFTKWKDGVEGTLIVAPNTSWGGTNRGPLGSVGNIYPFASTSSTARVSSAIRLALETIAFAWASNSTGAAIGVLGWEDNL